MLRITEFRKRKNLSQDALANLTKISARMISDYEKGNKDIPLKKLQLIATVLDCTVIQLIGGSEVDKDNSAELATTKQRLLIFLDSQGITNTEFLTTTGIKRGFLDTDKLQASVSDIFLSLIIKHYKEIDLEWLISGKGDMLRTFKDFAYNRNSVDIINGTVSAGVLERSDILNKIKEYYGFSKESDFADFLNISPQVLSNWNSRNTFDIEKVYERCPDINAHWLISGTGSMLSKLDGANSLDSIKLLQEQISELKKDKTLLASIIESKL